MIEHDITDNIIPHIYEQISDRLSIRETWANLNIRSSFHHIFPTIMVIEVVFDHSVEIYNDPFTITEYVDDFDDTIKETKVPALKDVMFVISNIEVNFIIRIYFASNRVSNMLEVTFKNCIFNKQMENYYSKNQKWYTIK